jgi:hypothetical protein
MYDCPSGYNVTRVLKRYAMNADVQAAQRKTVHRNRGDEREGDDLVVKKYADGSFQRVQATPDAAAEKWIDGSPGCRLAAR